MNDLTVLSFTEYLIDYFQYHIKNASVVGKYRLVFRIKCNLKFTVKQLYKYDYSITLNLRVAIHFQSY